MSTCPTCIAFSIVLITKLSVVYLHDRGGHAQEVVSDLSLSQRRAKYHQNTNGDISVHHVNEQIIPWNNEVATDEVNYFTNYTLNVQH